MFTEGLEFAHFKILHKLGEGGMGAVYLAQDQKLGRRVALKILPSAFTQDADRRERFQREARVAASISHPNVTGIFDLGEAKDPQTGETLSYIVMEYVKGSPLHQVLAQRRLDMAELLRLAEKIASGLAAAHKLNIVHRDIKPENIMITEDDEPRILDFGLAKPLESPFQVDETGADKTVAEDITQVGKIVGTVQYMSPEQAQGISLDTRSDVFSFGVLLYRLAVGDTPFSGNTQMSTLAQIIEGSHKPVRARNPAIPPELERIIEKCLQKDPKNRYQDTRDLVVDLRQLRRQFDSGVTDTSVTQEMSAIPAGGRKWTLPAVVGVLVVVAAVAVFSVMRGDRGGSVADAGENNISILKFKDRTGDQELAWLATGLPEIMVTDLSRCEGLSVISRDRVRGYLKSRKEDADHGELVEASRKAGATRILTGSYFKYRDQIRIEAQMEDVASGKILFAESVTGEDAFAVVDSLTRVVTAKLHVTDATPHESISEITTASSDAYKHYHLGEEKFLLGLFDEARDEFDQAVAADSTFALPYMRIAMSHIFEGRAQQGKGFLRKAVDFKDKLPPRDRSILDLYADIWLNQEYGDVYTKLEALVETYPQDKEILSIYGSLAIGFSADTTKGFAQFEKVLEMDPSYPWALNFYAQHLQQYEQYERAIEMYRRLKEAFPESYEPYAEIGDCYVQLGEFDRALAAYEEILVKFPDQAGPLTDLSSMAIRKRDFDEARAYARRILTVEPDSDTWRQRTEYILGNIDVWEGRFKDCLQRHRNAVRISFAMEDSARIQASLANLADWQRRFENLDSMVVYSRKSYDYADHLSRMRYPADVVMEFPERAEELRPLLENAIQDFKTHVPDNLWFLADGVQTLFNAAAARDTAGIVAYFDGVTKLPPNFTGPEAKLEYARWLVRLNRFEEALPLLDDAMGEDVETTEGWRYLEITYLRGRCHEGMGKAKDAVKKYEEVLRFWGNADIEIEPVRETRARLKRLTS